MPQALVLLGALIGALSVFVEPAAAEEVAPPTPARTAILLNGMWQTQGGTFDVPAGPAGVVRVPEALQPRGGRTQVWYRLRFALPSGLRRGRRALLTFDKTGHHVRVVLNGQVLGEHYGIRLPFTFDATEALREGAENELLVSAHVPDLTHARPGGVASAEEAKGYDIYWSGTPGGWYPPGILGDVVLSFVPSLRVEDAVVWTSFRKRTVDVRVEVANHDRATARVTVQAAVLTLDGSPTGVVLADRVVSVRPGDRTTVPFAGDFPDAAPWPDGGRDTPPLYVLQVRLLVDGRVMDATIRRFAFREVWTDGRDLVLNGKKLLLAASATVTVHERQRLAHLFSALRAVGVDLVDLHWDDAPEGFYDLADEAGMLVMPELYCSGPPPLTSPVVAGPSWVEDMRREVDEWVRLRRDHAAIVLWSPYDLPPPSRVPQADLDSFEERILALDATRPIRRRDVLSTSIADAGSFVGNPHDVHREAYRNVVKRSQVEKRPLIVREIANLAATKPDDVRHLLDELRADGITAYGGMHLEQAALERRSFDVTWPSLSGPDGRPLPAGGRALDVVNWSDPSRSSFEVTPKGDLLRRLRRESFGPAPAPLGFVRSPELLVVAPRRAGDRGFALVTPVSGAAVEERGTLLDPAGTGWLMLTAPGTYRVRLAGAAARAVTVEARGRPFSARPGYEHLQRVVLDPP